MVASDASAIYDPGTGRFLQRDPSGYPDGMNGYAAYHVLRGTLDPSGMDDVFAKPNPNGGVEIWVKPQIEFVFGLTPLSWGEPIYIGELVHHGVGTLVDMGGGQHTTLAQIKDEANNTWPDWDSFYDRQGFPLDLGINKAAKGLRGALIGRRLQAEHHLGENIYHGSIDDCVTTTEKAVVLVYEAAFWYGTSGLTLESSLKASAALLKSGIKTTPLDPGKYGRTTVFRVDDRSGAFQRLIIGSDGSVTIQGDSRMLFLTFGDRKRAYDFLAQKLGQGQDRCLRTFEVPSSFVDDLRKASVLEAQRKRFPNAPVQVDVTKTLDSFGLPKEQIDLLKDAIIQGTGKVEVP